MSDEQAKEIRAVLALLDTNDENTIRMPAIVAFHNNAESWIVDLLAERERLQALADAARAWSDEIGDAPYMSVNWNRYATYNAFRALRDALAAYEGALEPPG